MTSAFWGSSARGLAIVKTACAPTAFGMYMVSLMRKGSAGPVEPPPPMGPAWPVGRAFQPCVPTRPAWKPDLLLEAFQPAGGLLTPARSNLARSVAALPTVSAASSKRKSRLLAMAGELCSQGDGRALARRGAKA